MAREIKIKDGRTLRDSIPNAFDEYALSRHDSTVLPTASGIGSCNIIVRKILRGASESGADDEEVMFYLLALPPSMYPALHYN